MKKFFSRAMALLLAGCMISSTMVQNVSADDPTVDVADVSVQTQEEQTDDQSIQNAESALEAVTIPEEDVAAGAEAESDLNDVTCAITDVAVADGNASVSYNTNIPGTITVKLYDKDTYDNAADVSALTANASAGPFTVSSGEEAQAYTLPVDGTVPDYFYIIAEFTDADGNVVNRYENSLYATDTQAELLLVEPQENSERVLRLGGNNWLTFADGTQLIKDGNQYSLDFDSTTHTVTISGVPTSLSSLTDEELAAVTSLTFMVDRSSYVTSDMTDYTSVSITTLKENTDNFLPIQVDTTGTTPTKSADGTSISFTYVPFDSVDYDLIISEIYYEQSANTSGAGYATIGGGDPTAISIEKDGAKVVGTVKPTLTVDTKFIKKGTLGFKSVEHLMATLTLEYSLTVSGSTTDETYAVGDDVQFTDDNSLSKTMIDVSLPLGVGSVGVKVPIEVLFNGSGTITGKMTFDMDMGVSLTDSPTFEKSVTSVKSMSADKPGTFIQVGYDPQYAFKIGLEIGPIDVSLNNTMETDLYEQFKSVNVTNLDCVHYCTVDQEDGCTQWEETTLVALETSMGFNIFKWGKQWELSRQVYKEQPKSEHYSKTYNEQNSEACTHYGWPVKVTVKYSDGTPAANAQVTVPVYDTDEADQLVRRYVKGVTDENGYVKIYLPESTGNVIEATLDSATGQSDTFDVAKGEQDLEKTIILQTKHYTVNVVWKDGLDHDGVRADDIAFHMESSQSGSSEGDSVIDWVTGSAVSVSGWTDNSGSKTVNVGVSGNHHARLDAETNEYTYYTGDTESESGTEPSESKTIEVVKYGDTYYKVEYVDTEDENGGSTTATLTELKTFSVNIKWQVGNETQDHPETVKVQLQSPYGQFKSIPYAQYWTSEAELELSDANGWSGEFAPVPAYTDDGEEITYRVREIRQLASAIDGHFSLPVWSKDDKDTLAIAFEKVPLLGDTRNTVSYDVPAYESAAKGGTVSKHSTKYVASYETSDTSTTITNLAVVDVTIYKRWQMDEKDIPESVYLMVQSRYDPDYIPDGVENSWTPALNPVSGSTINLADIFLPDSWPEGLKPSVKLPIAIGKATKTTSWKVTFRLKKYGDLLGEPLQYQGVEAISGGIKDVVQMAVKQLTGFDLSTFLDFISVNPFGGYVSTYLPRAMGTDTSKYTAVANIKWSGDGEGENVIAGTKLWEGDEDAPEGTRPDSVTVYLKKDGKRIQTFTLNDDNYWSWTYEVPEEDQDAEFSVEEVPVDNYESECNGLNVINTYTGEKVQNINADVTCIWDDDDNRDGIRPDALEVTLLANEQDTGKRLSINEADSWEDVFKDLSVYDEKGNEITYTLQVPETEGYTTNVTGNAREGFIIEKKHEIKLTAVEGHKTWAGEAEKDESLRPSSITIHLLANGTEVQKKEVTSDDGWRWNFADLPVNDNGKAIEYTIKEDAVDNYNTEVIGTDVTNTYSKGNTSVTVTTVWIDDNDSDGLRPDSYDVSLQGSDQSMTLEPANNWAGTFMDLPVGETYTLIVPVIKNYDTVVSGDAASGYVVTATHTPKTTSVSGTKHWTGGTKSSRPDSITIRLLANGEEVQSKQVKADSKGSWIWEFDNLPIYKDGEKIEYTVKEDAVENYTAQITGYDISNTYNQGKTSLNVNKVWNDDNDRDGIRPDSVTVWLYRNNAPTKKFIVLNEINDWTDAFTDLPVYDDDGNKITYTVDEVPVSGYAVSITGDQEKGYTITNTHEIETLDEKTVQIKWENHSTAGLYLPNYVTVRLYANGRLAEYRQVPITSLEPVSLTFDNLPKYENGEEIIYTVTQDTVDQHCTSVTLDPESGVFDVVNAYEPGWTRITVTKSWDDDYDRDGIRPETDGIVVGLLENGTYSNVKATLNAANNWTCTFRVRTTKDNGSTPVYSVRELSVPDGYTCKITGSAKTGYVITNTHTPETVSVSGTKTWVGDTTDDRPLFLSIYLNASTDGGNTYQEKDLKIVFADSEDNWSWTFDNLYKYEDGKEIIYSVAEEPVDGYFTMQDGYNLTNIYLLAKTSVQVSKVWNDDGDRDGIRPDSVTVKLLRDGEDTGKTLVLDKNGEWTGSFDNLQVYENAHKYVYTVEEVKSVDGYTCKITGDAESGFVLTNTHEIKTTNIEGSKIWEKDKESLRPDSITIRLYANGKEIDSKEVTAKDNWSWKFENEPYNENGEQILYTISEDAIEDYSSEVIGYDVKNTFSPGNTSLTVTKAWNDCNNKDKIRPGKVTVKLLADGKDTGKTIVLKAKNNWVGSFTDLPSYDGTEKITYTVEEVAVDKYTSKITGDAVKGYVITNTHIPSNPKQPDKVNTVNTGDTTNLLLWCLLLMAAAAGVLLTLRLNRKRN